jgi:DNA-binding NarL/FixJ family response regulator
MINVVLIGNNLEQEQALLESQTDLTVEVLSASTIEQTLESIPFSEPHVFILDEATSEVSPELLCHFLCESYPQANSIIMIENQPTFAMLESSGFKARGFITSEQRRVLDKAVRVINDGEAWLPRKLVGDMLNRFSTPFVKMQA